MNDFVEKLIERLEEKALEHGANGQEFYANGYIDYAVGEYDKREAYYKAIIIIKQLAEEYKPKTQADKIRSFDKKQK